MVIPLISQGMEQFLFLFQGCEVARRIITRSGRIERRKLVSLPTERKEIRHLSFMTMN